MAMRMAISRRRVAPRASSRLATLTQAISSRNPTAPMSTSSGFSTEPESSSRQRKNRRPPAAVEDRIGLLEAIAEGVHLGAHLRSADARPHGGDHHEEPAVVDARVAGIHAERNPEIGGAVQDAKSRRHHSHDGVALVVEADGLAGDGAVGAEAAPQRVAQKGGIGAAGLVFFGAERRPTIGWTPRSGKSPAEIRRAGSSSASQLAARAFGEIEVDFLISADRFEGAALLPQARKLPPAASILN
jgi:hypothetical protein